MVDNKNLIGGTIGTMISALSINIDNLRSIESIVAIICTSTGLIITIISSVVIPLIKWYKNAKKDGKIDAGEILEGTETLKDGLKDIQDNLEKLTDKEEDNKNKGE